MDTHWFKTQMKAAGVTQKDLAQAINRDRSAVSRIINGTQSMELWQVGPFAEALHVSREEVLSHAGLDLGADIVFRTGDGVIPIQVKGRPKEDQDQLALMSEVLVSIMESLPPEIRPSHEQLTYLVHYETQALLREGGDHTERVRFLRHAVAFLKAFLKMR